VGRTEELASLSTRLAEAACRLLTLVGPGGNGKTRLAIELARQKAPDFANGVYFVALQPVSSPDRLTATIAEGIGFSFYGQDDPEAQLLSFLSERQSLLLLDNFEHLLETADLLARMLAAAPGLKLLVTSREALNLQEEWLWHVRGMHFPDADRVADIEAFSALKLFTERARRVRQDFSPEAEQSCIIRICQLVGGTPLALELAAAWLKTLPCDKIVHEIERNLDFLASNMRNIPERHRSMRAVFEQSWLLLSEDERLVLKRLSVFRGGFRQPAAEAVAGASLLTLSSLADKSLLYVDASGRFEIHELLRQFAEERLEREAGERELTTCGQPGTRPSPTKISRSLTNRWKACGDSTTKRAGTLRATKPSVTQWQC
jgi:predicted ATPase